jgi:transcriptional regulator with XRE-family HTH domain
MLTLMAKNLGQRIRELREQNDYSLREFAKKMDISAAHQSDIELGRRFPSEDLLAKTAPVLKTTVEELLRYDTRAPIEDLKRIAEEQPAYGFALRKMMEQDVRPDDILKWLEDKSKQEKKK